MALMAGVFDIIAKYTVGLDAKKVTKVCLKVGELTNAVPDALQAAFSVYAQGTNVEGATLEIEEIPLICCCQDCDWQGKIEKYFFICPKCTSGSLEVVSGRELRVDSLEVD
jgi:hydrogenase nickel incorporation protein HypA/HybF